jgi:hypothetical protein
VAGWPRCVTFRMVVGHESTFRFAVAPGPVAAGPKFEEASDPSNAFDNPSAILGTYRCQDLPSGCGGDMHTGDYTFNITLPSTLAEGTHTLQVSAAAFQALAKGMC